MIKYILPLLAGALLLLGGSSKEEPVGLPASVERVVLVYMAADNDLWVNVMLLCRA